MKKFLKNLWDTISPFFKTAAKTAIGKMADSIASSAQTYVLEIEALYPNISGQEKFNIVKERLRMHYPAIKEAAINLAIELAVAIIKDNLTKK